MSEVSKALTTKAFWKERRFLWLAYISAALVIAAQKITQGFFDGSLFYDWGGRTAYENYRIFRTAFTYLAEGSNPYAGYSNGPWDLFKYSPAFALCMAPFAALPDWLGLPLWNLLNAVVLLTAILRLPVLSENQRVFTAWFVFIELTTSMQNSQSNGLTAGLMLWAFIAFERGKAWQAAGFVAGGGFIKIFGIFAAVLALLYPQRLKFSAWLAVWVVFLTLIPLLIVSPKHLWQVYQWWWELLRDDHAASVGLSVQGWLETWFGWTPSKMGVTLAGSLILLASVAVVSRKSAVVGRMLACASVLLWVVIFNHKAESPTFVIAMCGVALWWCAAEKTTWGKVLLWTTFVLVSLSSTDIFPSTVRREVIRPYVLKAVPCIVVWGVVTWKMLRQWRKQNIT